jgi:integrase
VLGADGTYGRVSVYGSSAEEVDAKLTAIKLFVVALALGLRRGELLGLRWVDVDFTTGQLRVWQTLQRVRGEGVIFGPPKSRRSRRVLTMPTVVTDALRQHQTRQREDQKAAGDRWTDSGLVFTTATGGYLEPRNLNTTFARLLTRTEVRAVRLHDLRHTCATLLLPRGVSLRMAMDILGHSQIAVTMNTYGHVIPAMQHEAAGHMDAALGDDLVPNEDEADEN